MAFGKQVPDNSSMQPATPNWSTTLQDPLDPTSQPGVATKRVNRSTFVFVFLTFWVVTAGLYGLGVATNKEPIVAMRLADGTTQNLTIARAKAGVGCSSLTSTECVAFWNTRGVSIDQLKALDAVQSRRILTVSPIVLLFVPLILAQIRRHHDVGRTGWAVLLNAIPVLGLLVLLSQCFQNGSPGTNAYGSPPRRGVSFGSIYGARSKA